MIITRGPIAAVILATATVGLAGPASADDPANPAPGSATPTSMSGSFTATEEGSAPAVWTFTPCGDGCVTVTFADGRKSSANLSDGQWRLDELDNPTAVKCVSDGSEHPGSAHFSWDPVTLVGQTWATDDSGACNALPGLDTDGVSFTLTPVS